MREKRNDISSNKEVQFDIESIIWDVLKQWWVILLAALTAAVLCGAYLKFSYKPQYTTVTTFVVGKNGVSSNMASDNLNSAKSLTESFTQIVNSNMLRKRVCEELGLGSFDAEVSVSVVESSNLMTMTVRAGAPRTAYLIIHSVMENVTEFGAELIDNISVRVLQEPSVPTGVSNPLNTEGPMKKAGVFGALLAAAVFAFISYNKDTVKNEREMTAKIDSKLLGTVYHENKYKTLSALKNRKKHALTIDNTALSFGYVEAIRMTASRVQRELDRAENKVLMVTSVSENEGKSTVAANIALALSMEGHRVILMDCDFRKPSQYKILEIPEDSCKDNDLGDSVINGAPIVLKKAGAEKKLEVALGVKSHNKVMNVKSREYFKSVLESLKKEADYIIVDSAPMALVTEGEILAGLCDASLLVVRQDVMEAQYINDMIDRLNRTNGKVIGCVYNNVRLSVLARSREYGRYYGYGRYKYGGYSRYGYYGKKHSKRSKGE